MRPAGRPKAWLSEDKMLRWLQTAPDKASYNRRLAIWLTHSRRLHANRIAQILGVSTQAVWLWISQYNSQGPAALDRKGRGGRRWAFLTLKQEAELLKPFIQKARSGCAEKAIVIKTIVEEKLGRKVSMPYIYRLLQRHNWAETIAQSRSGAKPLIPRVDFEKLSRPWLRER